MSHRLALFRSVPTPSRAMRGGRPTDAGRLPRYALIFILGTAAFWAPITAYVTMTPPSFTSDVSLILPGSGAQASVNLADIGQASSSAASAFSSSRVSPTQTYKRLLAAQRTLDRAAETVGMDASALGAPRIKLVDETSLIHFEMTGPSPEAAQARAEAVLAIFLDELEALRTDELAHRDIAARAAIVGYEQAVADLRVEIDALRAEAGIRSHAHYETLVADRDALARRLDEARSEHAAAKAATDELSAHLGLDARAAALNLRLHADPEFQKLAGALALNASALAENRGRYGARHPLVTDAVHAVRGTTSKLEARGRSVLGAGSDLVLARLDVAPDPARAALLSDLVARATQAEASAATVATLDAQLAALEARLVRLAPLAAQLDEAERADKVAEAVLSSALARTDTSKADVFASYPLVQVLADASLPTRATSPRPKIAIAAGVAATLMLLMGLALAWLRRPIIDGLLAKGDA